MIYSTLFPNFLFWVFFIVFFFSVFLAFFIPGDLLLRRINLSIFQRIILGTSIGIILWSWQGYVFGYANIRWMSYIYLFIFLALWVNYNFAKLKRTKIKNLLRHEINISILLIIIIGSIIQLSSVWFAGVGKNEGIYFFAYSVPDNLWYMDLTNEVVNRIPPFEPGMFGKVIENYHYWSNLVMAELIRVFNLPLIPTVSQYFTILMSILLGGSIIVFSQIINLKKSILAWILLFFYFGGDFVNLFQILFGNGIDFNQRSMEDGAKFLANPPRAFALVLFFAGINFISMYIEKKNILWGILTALVFGSLIGFKVYVGFFALTGMFFLSAYYLFKREYNFIIFTSIAVVLSLLIYMPVNKNAGGLFYSGFWRAEDFVTLPTLGLSHLELARRIFSDHNNWFRVLLYDLLFFFILTLGTFGTKIMGFFQSRNSLKVLPLQLNIFLISSLIVSFILGTFFLQSSGGSNSFNFLVSTYVVISIYAGIVCFHWLNKLGKNLKIILTILLILITIPRAGYQIVDNIRSIYNTYTQEAFFEKDDLEAMDRLKNSTSPSSLIMNQPGVSFPNFIIDRPVFLYGHGILITHEIDISARQKTQNNIFNSDKIDVITRELAQNNIDFIYRSDNQLFLGAEYRKFIDFVFSENGNQLLRVNKEKLKDIVKN